MLGLCKAELYELSVRAARSMGSQPQNWLGGHPEYRRCYCIASTCSQCFCFAVWLLSLLDVARITSLGVCSGFESNPGSWAWASTALRNVRPALGW